MDVLRYGDLQLGWHAEGAATWRCRGMELRCSLQACKRGGVELWKSGAREARCGRADVEV